MVHGVHLSKEMSPKTLEDETRIDKVSYFSIVRSIMYAMICIILGVSYELNIMSQYKSNLSDDHWTTVKNT